MRFRGVVAVVIALALCSATGWAQDVRNITEQAAGISASTYQNEPPDNVNPPGSAFDNDIGTRWAAETDNEWLKVDLGMSRPVSGVHVAVYQGDARQAIFDIQVSNDNTNWTDVLTNVYSSGTTDQEEAYTFDTVSARYVRYMGHMNTVNQWNAVTELTVFAPDPDDVFYEGENLEVLDSSGDSDQVSANAEASGGYYYMMNSNAVGDFVELKIPNLPAGVYNVVLGVKEHTTRGIVQVSLGAVGGGLTSVGGDLDLYEDTGSNENFPELHLGAWKASTTGDKVLRLEVVGRNPDSIDAEHTLAVDYVRFE